MTNEIRVHAGMQVETRAENDAPGLVGYAAVFDTEADIAGMFREVIRKGAFADAITRDDIHALDNHDYGRVIGRKKSGTLKIYEDDRGLRVEITPPDTTVARDLMANIAAGNIDQMSFAFSMEGGRQAWDETGDMPLRTIEKVGELFEVSVVPRGAFETTEVGLRSLAAFRTLMSATEFRARQKARLIR